MHEALPNNSFTCFTDPHPAALNCTARRAHFSGERCTVVVRPCAEQTAMSLLDLPGQWLGGFPIGHIDSSWGFRNVRTPPFI